MAKTPLVLDPRLPFVRVLRFVQKVGCLLTAGGSRGRDTVSQVRFRPLGCGLRLKRTLTSILSEDADHPPAVGRLSGHLPLSPLLCLKRGNAGFFPQDIPGG